ncbi:hypothetical protein E9549_02670 [Blastococcus sp. MG754426]|nr:hypothetical protein [Blastococcus sp. MG754426]MCF6510869.1 hypothetical protein [Blastococcus sp. MG754427]
MRARPDARADTDVPVRRRSYVGGRRSFPDCCPGRQGGHRDHHGIDIGIDVRALTGTAQAIEEDPGLGASTFRARSRWQDGTCDTGELHPWTARGAVPVRPRSPRRCATRRPIRCRSRRPSMSSDSQGARQKGETDVHPAHRIPHVPPGGAPRARSAVVGRCDRQRHGRRDVVVHRPRRSRCLAVDRPVPVVRRGHAELPASRDRRDVP